jgi:uncharacterized protein
MYGDTVAVPANEIERFCQRWKIQELALFGSVLRENFDASSDVDVLVTFTDDAQWSLLDHVQMENELAEMVGRNVDLISKRAVEKSQNWIRREAILETARVLFSR